MHSISAMNTDSIQIHKKLPVLFAGLGIIFINVSGCSKQETQIALERADCVVQLKTHENSSVKCAIAFSELFPLIDGERKTLNGTYVYWNSSGALKKDVGDTIYVYRMISVIDGFWSKDTVTYFCVNDTKKDNHEYDLFLQYLKKNVKEETVQP